MPAIQESPNLIALRKDTHSETKIKQAHVCPTAPNVHAVQ